MDVRNKQPIQEHLQKADVQERILQSIHRGRDEATVTISRAAELFGITENKLRDWEEYGFLNPLRPGGPKGRRLYTPTELDKLAIIRELINAGYAASDIPPDIDQLWHAIRLLDEQIRADRHVDRTLLDVGIDQPINIRISQTRANLFWRYYISHTLRLALKLICEDIPNTTAGILLPLSTRADDTTIQRVEDLASLGTSIVGWLSQSGSSHTLLTTRPTFQYSSDFRVEMLRAKKADITQKETAQNNTIIVLQREASPLTLSVEVVETIQRLLQPIYQDTERSQACLNMGMRDILDPATDLDHSLNHEDVILNGLADMVVRLGGQTDSGQSRWRLCWLLTPRDASLPLHLSNLVIRAKNQDSSYKSKSAIPIQDKQSNTPYIKALRSRHIIYQPNIPTNETPGTFRDLEHPIRSVIALPIGGEDGLPVGVLYVASHLVDAFNHNDQRILRLMSRLIEELLKTYRVRQQVTQKLSDMIKNPELVDTLFAGFASENDFNRDVEKLLQAIQNEYEEEPASEKLGGKTVSFIALDIDKQSSLANRYGERLVRNLTREVGLRVQEQMRSFFKEYPDCQLYHIYADRFFILLRNTSLEQASEHAEQLRLGAIGPYKIDALRIFADQQTRPDSLIELTNITIRLGVTSYPYIKLMEILREHSPGHAITAVRTTIASALDVALVKGQIEGGNVVISWNYDIRNFVRWSHQRGK